jgi:hypothetical protein
MGLTTVLKKMHEAEGIENKLINTNIPPLGVSHLLAVRLE